MPAQRKTEKFGAEKDGFFEWPVLWWVVGSFITAFVILVLLWTGGISK